MSWSEGDGRKHTYGPFASDMPPPRGVSVTDMPSAKPVIPEPKVKGVPRATGTEDEDHQPGSGTWQPV
jgi:hypothetical protein